MLRAKASVRRSMGRPVSPTISRAHPSRRSGSPRARPGRRVPTPRADRSSRPSGRSCCERGAAAPTPSGRAGRARRLDKERLILRRQGDLARHQQPPLWVFAPMHLPSAGLGHRSYVHGRGGQLVRPPVTATLGRYEHVDLCDRRSERGRCQGGRDAPRRRRRRARGSHRLRPTASLPTPAAVQGLPGGRSGPREGLRSRLGLLRDAFDRAAYLLDGRVHRAGFVGDRARRRRAAAIRGPAVDDQRLWVSRASSRSRPGRDLLSAQPRGL